MWTEKKHDDCALRGVNKWMKNGSCQIKEFLGI
jgi:hypothetical protein